MTTRALGAFGGMLVAGATLLSPLPAVAQQTLSLDSVHEGSLDSSDPVQGDGTFYDRFVIPCVAGTSLRITLRSDDFDAYLTAAAPESTEWIKDDDGAGGTDSAILLTPQTSGTCQVAATSYRPETGRYVLVASLRDEDVTVSSLEDVVADVVAQWDDPVVASGVGVLGGGDPLLLHSLDLEAGATYGMLAVIEGNDPLSATLEFTVTISGGEELLRTAPSGDTELTQIPGFQVVTMLFEAPEIDSGDRLFVALSYGWTDNSRSRRAAMVLFAR